MFTTTAYAQGLGMGDAQSQMLTTFAPLILIFAVFYFLLIRPQQKRAKDHQTMLKALRRGDKVVTGGGLIGTVAKVIDDNEVEVDLNPTNRVRVVRSTITSVIARTEPVAAKEKADAGEADAAEPAKDKRKGAARSAAGK
jgi:preprotein translocase subunit YajC